MLWKIYRWLSPDAVDGGGAADGGADAGAGGDAGGELPPGELGLEEGAAKADEAGEAGDGEGDKAAKKPGWQKRIDTLTKRNKEADERFNALTEKYEGMESMMWTLLGQLQSRPAPAPAAPARATDGGLPPEIREYLDKDPAARDAFRFMEAVLDHKLGPVMKKFEAFQGQTQAERQQAAREAEVQQHQSRMVPIMNRVIAKEAADFANDPIAERFIAVAIQTGLEKTLFSDQTWDNLPDPLKWGRFETEVARHVSQAVALLKQRDTSLLKRGDQKIKAAGAAVPASAKVAGGAAPVANEKQQEILRDLAAGKLTPSQATDKILDSFLAGQRGGG